MTSLPCINENLNISGTYAAEYGRTQRDLMSMVWLVTKTQPITGHIHCPTGFSKSRGLFSIFPFLLPLSSIICSNPTFPTAKTSKPFLWFSFALKHDRNSNAVITFCDVKVTGHHHQTTEILNLFLEFDEKISILDTKRLNVSFSSMSYWCGI